MNNSEGETRLCKKCGKRLPSSNNFCMYCGYNNNLNDEELEALKAINANNIHTQNKQELLNKSIAAKDREIVIEKEKHNKIKSEEEIKLEKEYKERKSSPLKKAIYALMLVDIIVISVLFLFKGNSLLIEKADFDLSNYEQLVNVYNTNFLALKDNKIYILGDKKKVDFKDLKKINSEGVVGFGRQHFTNGTIFIETKKNFYYLNSSYSSDKGTEFKANPYKGKKILGNNFYEDLNAMYGKKSTTNDYYFLLDENYYFIKGKSLYKTVLESKNRYEKPTLYSSKKVIDDIKVDNPEIIYASDTGRSLVVKGDSIIKIFTDGELIQSISKFIYDKKTYKISDFKYIFLDENRFRLILNNGSSIEYSHDFSIIKDTEYVNEMSNSYSKYIKDNNIIKKEFNKTINIDKESHSYSSSSDDPLDVIMNLLGDDITVLVVLIVALIILIGVIYFFREKSIVLSSFIYGGVILLYIFLFAVYNISKMPEPKYFEAIKLLFTAAPASAFIGFIFAQIKEIVNYISDKFNIETIYHFILLLIAIITTLLAISVFTSNFLIGLIFSSFMWILVTLNDEDFVEDEIDLNMLLKIIGCLLISLIVSIIICNIFKICNYYLCIVFLSFCISCYLVLNNDITIINSIKKIILSNINLIFVIAFAIISIIYTIFTMKVPSGFEKIAKETRNLYWKFVGGAFVLLFIIIIISVIIGLIVFGISKLSKLLKKYINNRVLLITAYMIIVCIILSLIVLLIPYITDLLNLIFSKMLKADIDINSITNIFGY